MALLKILKIGDELIFDVRKMAPESKEISVQLSETEGKVACFKIRAHKSIPIHLSKQETIPEKHETLEELKFRT